jgi:hypothetical protein
MTRQASTNNHTFATGFMTVNEAGKYTFDVLADARPSSHPRFDRQPRRMFSTTVNAAAQWRFDRRRFHDDGGCCGDIFGTYNLGIGSYTF